MAGGGGRYLAALQRTKAVGWLTTLAGATSAQAGKGSPSEASSSLPPSRFLKLQPREQPPSFVWGSWLETPAWRLNLPPPLLPLGGTALPGHVQHKGAWGRE